MNILTDRHHSDLAWSLQLLADRLGATLYFPAGMAWYEEGYFGCYGNLRAKDPNLWIAKQYLVDTIYDLEKGDPITREIYEGCTDYPHLKFLTLDQAKKVGLDIIICTLKENEPYFAKLKEFYPNAKFIRQVGNDLDTLIDNNLYPNLLASATAPFEAFQGPNKVLYKQEFPLELFKYEEPSSFRNVYTFQGDIEQFEETWEFWTDLKHQLRDFNFKAYGVGNDNGKIYPKKEYIKKMLEATFIVQSKGPWEGYGHVLWNSIQLGRPMIIKFSDYQGKIAEPLLVKDETYLEMTDPDIIEKIRYYSQIENYRKMSNNCRQKAVENINFDREFEEKLKPFFENLS